ncbi:MAG: hypothetical protein NT163_02915 [Chlorobiales bacterium]|nr:hypothetical protein [Chlorobiales bacterium]
MATEKVNQSTLPFKGKLYTVLLGALIIILSTTVPYLTLLNVFLFAGIFLAGTVALHNSIMLFQVRLTYNQAFLLGCVAGLVGGVVSEGITFLLMELFNYRPGTESLALVIDWALEMAKGRPEVQQQVQALVAAEKLALVPVKLSFIDILMNMLFSGAFYAPIAGLGGAFAVLRLKRKAARG